MGLNEFSEEPDTEAVPHDCDDDFTPDGYEPPDYDETEPLEGDTHERADS